MTEIHPLLSRKGRRMLARRAESFEDSANATLLRMYGIPKSSLAELHREFQGLAVEFVKASKLGVPKLQGTRREVGQRIGKFVDAMENVESEKQGEVVEKVNRRIHQALSDAGVEKTIDEMLGEASVIETLQGKGWKTEDFLRCKATPEQLAAAYLDVTEHSPAQEHWLERNVLPTLIHTPARQRIEWIQEHGKIHELIRPAPFLDLVATKGVPIPTAMLAVRKGIDARHIAAVHDISRETKLPMDRIAAYVEAGVRKSEVVQAAESLQHAEPDAARRVQWARERSWELLEAAEKGRTPHETVAELRKADARRAKTHNAPDSVTARATPQTPSEIVRAYNEAQGNWLKPAEEHEIATVMNKQGLPLMHALFLHGVRQHEDGRSGQRHRLSKWVDAFRQSTAGADEHPWVSQARQLEPTYGRRGYTDAIRQRILQNARK